MKTIPKRTAPVNVDRLQSYEAAAAKGHKMPYIPTRNAIDALACLNLQTTVVPDTIKAKFAGVGLSGYLSGDGSEHSDPWWNGAALHDAEFRREKMEPPPNIRRHKFDTPKNSGSQQGSAPLTEDDREKFRHLDDGGIHEGGGRSHHHILLIFHLMKNYFSS